MKYSTFIIFFILSLQKPVCTLHQRRISVWTSHISRLKGHVLPMASVQVSSRLEWGAGFWTSAQPPGFQPQLYHVSHGTCGKSLNSPESWSLSWEIPNKLELTVYVPVSQSFGENPERSHETKKVYTGVIPDWIHLSTSKCNILIL